MSKRVSLVKNLCVLTFFLALTVGVVGQSNAPPVRIGIFDSRAVALSYWRSEQGTEQLADLQEEMKRAKAAKDKDRIRQLEFERSGLQFRMHQQVFSTGAVTDIIDKIKTDLPETAKEARVSLIVSKWQIAIADKDPSIEYVDMTSQLVGLFKPSDEVMKMIEEIVKKNPVPIETISMDPRH